MDRSNLIDLRRYEAHFAVIGLQAIVVELMQLGPLSWLEADDELGWQAARRTHADMILSVYEPEDATMDRNFGDTAPGIYKAKFFGHSEQVG